MRRIACIPILACCIALAMAAVPASLLETKAPRGLDFILQNSPTPQKYLIETMPGGVALFDYNNDGLLDICTGKIKTAVSPTSRKKPA